MVGPNLPLGGLACGLVLGPLPSTCVGNDLVSCAIPQYTPMSVLRAPGFDTDYLVGKFTYYGLSSTYLFPYVLT